MVADWKVDHVSVAPHLNPRHVGPKFKLWFPYGLFSQPRKAS